MPKKSLKTLDTKVEEFFFLQRTAQSTIKEMDLCLQDKATISASQYGVLIALEEAGGTLTSAKVAQKTGTRPHNITMMIDRLERDGLVSTEKKDPDRRFVFISLTDNGKSALEKAKPAARKLINTTMAAISETELTVLHRILTYMARRH